MTSNKSPQSVYTAKKAPKAVAVLLAGALLSATALTINSSFFPSQSANAQSTNTASALNHAPKQGFADLVEKVMPTVVSVEVRFMPVSTNDGESHSSFDEGFSQNSPFEFFDRFSKRRGKRGLHGDHPKRRGGRAAGSGFIVSADGFVVTNNHVVKNASQVTVKLSSGETFEAKVVGRDPKTDLAVLKLKSDKTFKFAKLAPKDPRVGDWVVAVGNPFGLGGSVTTGIVSASGRNIGSGPYDNFLQIDASINKGNSGGPAFNLAGEVIGVNTAIYSPSGGSVGIGFAIPASTTRQIVDALINKGTVTRGWLGVQIQSVTKDIAQSLGLNETKGTLVAGVNRDSPAQKAGLKTGDLIISINAKKVKDPQGLVRMIASVAPGETLNVGIIRKGKAQSLKVEIGKMPGADKLAGLAAPKPVAKSKLAKLGLAVETAPDGFGLIVRKVNPRGAAAKKGIRRGDVIIEVDGIDVSDTQTLKTILAEAVEDGNESVLFLLRSHDRQRFVAVPLQMERS